MQDAIRCCPCLAMSLLAVKCLSLETLMYCPFVSSAWESSAATLARRSRVTSCCTADWMNAASSRRINSSSFTGSIRGIKPACSRNAVFRSRNIRSAAEEAFVGTGRLKFPSLIQLGASLLVRLANDGIGTSAGTCGSVLIDSTGVGAAVSVPSMRTESIFMRFRRSICAPDRAVPRRRRTCTPARMSWARTSPGFNWAIVLLIGSPISQSLPSGYRHQ